MKIECEKCHMVFDETEWCQNEGKCPNCISFLFREKYPNLTVEEIKYEKQKACEVNDLFGDSNCLTCTFYNQTENSCNFIIWIEETK